jgi:FkbM family methyltransferase
VLERIGSVRRLLVKCPYYVGSLLVLVRALEPKGRVRGLLGRGPLVFRRGFALEAPELLDLLVAKETVCDDAYRLESLRDEAPRLIVDVGAGIGDFTVLAAWTFPEAEVLAFEPNPHSFAVLARNVRRNRLKNVRCRCVAVGTRPSYELSRSAWAATGTAFADSAGTTVTAAPLNALLGDRKVDFLKIDCEGAELEVLASLGEARRQVRRVALEYHDHLVEATADRVEKLLAAEGFVVRREPDRYDRRIGYLHGLRD